MYHFHVVVNVPGTPRNVVASLRTYEQARDIAMQRYTDSSHDTSIEISHAGLLVWGPFVVGGKYKPSVYGPWHYTIEVPWAPEAYQTEWHCRDAKGHWGYATLTRGAFTSWDDALTWARTHLDGTPYHIRLVGETVTTVAVLESAHDVRVVKVCLTVKLDDPNGDKAYERVQALLDRGTVRDAFTDAGMELCTAVATAESGRRE